MSTSINSDFVIPVHDVILAHVAIPAHGVIPVRVAVPIPCCHPGEGRDPGIQDVISVPESGRGFLPRRNPWMPDHVRHDKRLAYQYQSLTTHWIPPAFARMTDL